MLNHHTVFFPEDYANEFEDIFTRNIAPTDPTIYICYNGYSEEGNAPEGGSNLFVLVNAPYNNANWDWLSEGQAYRDKIIARLEQKLGPFQKEIEVEHKYHPGMLEADTGAYRGAIYGISSNTFNQAFFRPSNKAKDIANLWFTGGSTHPGGGTPIVTLSGQLVADEIIKTCMKKQ
jgi:phytoene dehydrogenase-like protein